MGYQPWFALAGSGWILWGAFGATDPDGYACSSQSEIAADTLFVGANLALTVGLLFLSRNVQGICRVLALALASGATVLGVGNLIEHCVASQAFILYVLGAVSLVVFGVGLGVMLLRAERFGLMAGGIVLFGALSLVAFSWSPGGVLFGVAWCCFALRAWMWPELQPS